MLYRLIVSRIKTCHFSNYDFTSHNMKCIQMIFQFYYPGILYILVGSNYLTNDLWLVMNSLMKTYNNHFLYFSYVEKFTEFIHSFVQSHLRRFENSLQFPIHDFLALLYKYTFAQPRPDGYMACLDIW